jgi:hypothetical protein
MVYTKWEREQYMGLAKLVQKKVSTDKMAAELKIDKPDLYYRLTLLKTRKNIKTWMEDELNLLERAKNLDEYVRGCQDLLGKDFNKPLSIDHWMNRDKYLSAWFKERDDRKKTHAIIIKNKQVPEPIKENGKNDALPDVGDQMATLINRVTENTAVLKDLLKVQQDTYTLFKKLDTVKSEGAKPSGSTNQ